MVTLSAQVLPWSETCGAPLVPNAKVYVEVLALFLELNMARFALFSQVAGSPAAAPHGAPSAAAGTHGSAMCSFRMRQLVAAQWQSIASRWSSHS